MKMILGKKIFLAKLPDKYTFALGTTNKPSYVEKLEAQVSLLKRYVKLIGSEENEQLVFKGVSTKRNKEDFKQIKEIINGKID